MDLEAIKIDPEEIKPFSIDEFRDRINKSMLDSKRNRLTENNDLLAEMQK
jgi:hypothetical protein